MDLLRATGAAAAAAVAATVLANLSIAPALLLAFPTFFFAQTPWPPWLSTASSGVVAALPYPLRRCVVRGGSAGLGLGGEGTGTGTAGRGGSSDSYGGGGGGGRVRGRGGGGESALCDSRHNLVPVSTRTATGGGGGGSGGSGHRGSGSGPEVVTLRHDPGVAPPWWHRLGVVSQTHGWSVAAALLAVLLVPTVPWLTQYRYSLQWSFMTPRGCQANAAFDQLGRLFPPGGAVQVDSIKTRVESAFAFSA